MQNVNFLTPARAWISPKLQELKSKTQRYLPEIGMTSAALIGCLLLSNSFQSLYHEYQAEKYSFGTLLSGTTATVTGCAGALILAGAAYAAKEYRKFQARTQKDKDILTEIINENPPPNPRNVALLIKTTYDRNNTFSLEDESNKENIKILSKQLKIEDLEIKTLEDITEKMRSLDAEGQIIKYLIFQGDGNWDRINFAARPDQDLTKHWIERSNFPGLEEDAHILFISNLTGVPDGIAQKFSKEFPQASVYAPSSVSHSGHSWIFLNPENKPVMIHFSQESQELITKLFKNNTPQRFPTGPDMNSLFDHISHCPVNSGNRLKDCTEKFLASIDENDERVTTYNLLKSMNYPQLYNSFAGRIRSMNQGVPPNQNFSQIKESANAPNATQNSLKTAFVDFLSLLYNAQLEHPLNVGALAGDTPEAIGSITEQRELLSKIQRSFGFEDKFDDYEHILDSASIASRRLTDTVKLFRDEKINQLRSQVVQIISHTYLLYLAGKPEDYATDAAFIAYSNRIRTLIDEAKNIKDELDALENSPQPIVLRGIESVITRVRN